MNRGKLHYQKCRDCQTAVWTAASKGTQVLCPACKEAVKRRKSNLRKRHEHYTRDVNTDALTVIYDPDPVGGFRPGAEIGLEAMKYMLKPKYSSFNIGTRLRDSTGRIHEIVALPEGGQRMVQVLD